MLLLGIMLLYAVAVYCGGAVNPDSLSVVDVFSAAAVLVLCVC